MTNVGESSKGRSNANLIITKKDEVSFESLGGLRCVLRGRDCFLFAWIKRQKQASGRLAPLFGAIRASGGGANFFWRSPTIPLFTKGRKKKRTELWATTGDAGIATDNWDGRGRKTPPPPCQESPNHHALRCINVRIATTQTPFPCSYLSLGAQWRRSTTSSPAGEQCSNVVPNAGRADVMGSFHQGLPLRR